MKYITIAIIWCFSIGLANGGDIKVDYSNGIATAFKNNKTILSLPYKIHPYYSKGAEKLLASMQLVYPVGNCLIINNLEHIPTEPHTPRIGTSIIYDLKGNIKEKHKLPIFGSFIYPLNNKWAVSLDNIEGDFESYTLISSECKYSVIKLPGNYKVYDGFNKNTKENSIEINAPKAWPSKEKVLVKININENQFTIE